MTPADSPEFGHGDAADRPIAVPKVSSTKDSAAASTAPAKTAPHSTKLAPGVSVLAAIGDDPACVMTFSPPRLAQPERAQNEEYAFAEWACYVDNVTPEAIRLKVPFGTIEKLPTMSDAEWTAMRALNKDQYGSTPTPRRPPAPKLVGHRSTVTLPEFNVSLPCLLDTGASITFVPARHTISNNVVTFTLAGQTIQRPILRMVTFVGFDDTRSEPEPVIQLILTVEGHTAIAEVGIGTKGTVILIGRDFMAGRLNVSSAAKRPQPVQPVTPRNKPAEDRDTEY